MQIMGGEYMFLRQFIFFTYLFLGVSTVHAVTFPDSLAESRVIFPIESVVAESVFAINSRRELVQHLRFKSGVWEHHPMASLGAVGLNDVSAFVHPNGVMDVFVVTVFGRLEQYQWTGPAQGWQRHRITDAIPGSPRLIQLRPVIVTPNGYEIVPGVDIYEKPWQYYWSFQTNWGFQPGG